MDNKTKNQRNINKKYINIECPTKAQYRYFYKMNILLIYYTYNKQHNAIGS